MKLNLKFRFKELLEFVIVSLVLIGLVWAIWYSVAPSSGPAPSWWIPISHLISVGAIAFFSFFYHVLLISLGESISAEKETLGLGDSIADFWNSKEAPAGIFNSCLCAAAVGGVLLVALFGFNFDPDEVSGGFIKRETFAVGFAIGAVCAVRARLSATKDSRRKREH